MRPAWRLLVFFVFFFLLAAAGNLAVNALPRSPLQWGNVIVSLAAALVAGWAALSRLDQRAPGALGFGLHRGALRESVVGTACGALLLTAAIVLLVVTGGARFDADAGSGTGYIVFLGWTFLYFSLAAAFEEVLFRGYPFQVLVDWFGVWPATIGVSGLFAVVHGQNPNVTALALVNIFLAGVLLSIAYLKTMSLWFVTGAHVGWNWTMATLFDFPVSGIEFDTPLYDGRPVGEDVWTGGAFGPEAGIVGTVVLGAGLFLLLRSRRVKPDADILKLHPLVEERVRNQGLI